MRQKYVADEHKSYCTSCMTYNDIKLRREAYLLLLLQKMQSCKMPLFVASIFVVASIVES